MVAMFKRFLPLLLVLAAVSAQEQKTDPADVRNEALKKARVFLASKQNKDGSFPINPDKLMGGDPYTVGMTAIAVFALLGDEDQREAIEKAVGFLINSMDKKGYIRIDKRTEHAPFFEHALATQAMTEVWTKDKDGKFLKDKDLSAALKGKVQMAVQWIVSSQIENGGWTYSPSSNVDEAFGTALQLDALRTVREAGLDVPEKVTQKAVAYLKQHAVKGGGFRCKPGWKVSYEGSATIAAVLLTADEADAKETKQGMTYLRTKTVKEVLRWLSEKEGKSVWMGGGIQLSGLFYAALAYRRSGDADLQKEYFPAMTEELLKNQKADGSWSGLYGDVYGTAFTAWLLSIM